MIGTPQQTFPHPTAGAYSTADPPLNPATDQHPNGKPAPTLQTGTPTADPPHQMTTVNHNPLPLHLWLRSHRLWPAEVGETLQALALGTTSFKQSLLNRTLNSGVARNLARVKNYRGLERSQVQPQTMVCTNCPQHALSGGDKMSPPSHRHQQSIQTTTKMTNSAHLGCSGLTL